MASPCRESLDARLAHTAAPGDMRAERAWDSGVTREGITVLLSMRIGFHVKKAGGWRKALLQAVGQRCSTLQVFTAAPVQWAREPLDPEEASWFASELRRLDIAPLFVHGIYLLNLASPDPSLWAKSRDALADELRRAALIRSAGVVVHLGSVGEGGDVATGLTRVARAVDEALEASDAAVPVVLENCAGAGQLIGATIEHLGAVIEQSRYPGHLEVCLDTAHALASGYPLHTPDGLDALLHSFAINIGLEKLALIHANDSKGALGSSIDRHAHIGKGEIGASGFRVILNHPLLWHLPFIMETPDEDDWREKDMRALRRLIAPGSRPGLPRVRAIGKAPPTE